MAADAVWCSREHTPYALHPMPGVYLSDFDEVAKADGGPFRVYSPFARAAKAAGWDDPLPAPPRVPVPEGLGPGAGPGGFGFGVGGAVAITPPDSGAALERLGWFVERWAGRYARARNYLAADGTSRLSPYLRFGLISPRQVAAAVGRGPRAGEHPGRAGDRETFVNELLWRAGAANLEAGGVRLGADYPHPIVDHTTARNRALARYEAMRVSGSRST